MSSIAVNPPAFFASSSGIIAVAASAAAGCNQVLALLVIKGGTHNARPSNYSVWLASQLIGNIAMVSSPGDTVAACHSTFHQHHASAIHQSVVHGIWE